MIVAALLAGQIGAVVGDAQPQEQEDDLTQVMGTSPWSLIYLSHIAACVDSFKDASSAEEYSVSVAKNISVLAAATANLEAEVKNGPLKGDGVRISSPARGECLVRHSGPSISEFRHGAMALLPFFVSRDPDSACKVASQAKERFTLTCTGPGSLVHSEEFSESKDQSGFGEFLYRARYVSGSSKPAAVSQDLPK